MSAAGESLTTPCPRPNRTVAPRWTPEWLAVRSSAHPRPIRTVGLAREPQSRYEAHAAHGRGETNAVLGRRPAFPSPIAKLFGKVSR